MIQNGAGDGRNEGGVRGWGRTEQRDAPGILADSRGVTSTYRGGGESIMLPRPNDDAQPPRRAPWSCSGCDRRWSSLTQAHCAGCHQQFSTVGVSDHHDRGGPCRHPGDVLKKDGTPVYRPEQTVDGIVWRTFERRGEDSLPDRGPA